MTNGTTPTENGVVDPAVLLSGAAVTNDLSGSSESLPPTEPLPPSFADLGLHPDVKLAIDDMGYFAPTPVQTAVFHPVTAGKDLMVQSRTGTGKTTAFGLPIINRLLPTHRAPQAMILTPTRELALQVARELTMIGKHRQILIECIYGGAPIGKQIKALQDGVHIIVGTPGRILDHIGRRTLDCRTISTFVLDECDEMLSMGFLEDIEKIASHLPEKRQTLLFSATMPDEVLRYSRRHMTAPEQISLSRDSISVSEIHHAYYIVSGIARSRDLLKIILQENPDSAIIFCNMRDETTMVAKFLQKQGLDAEPLSSDLSQADRERVMNRMKAHNLRFLCATDVAARGIDITDLSHVINYSVPEAPEIYVHRTGRTGRAGKKGTALSLVGPRELGNFRYVRLTYGIKPEERLLPKDEIFEGKLKVPLPPIGVPQAPDPVQILIRGVPMVGTGPTDLEKQITDKLLAKAEGRRVIQQLVAEKLNQLSTRTVSRPRPARVERPEGDAREGGGEGGERSERPMGDRPERSYDRDRGGDRGGRFDRDRGPRDRDRGGPGGGDRPRYGDRGGSGGGGGERSFDRDRGRDRDRGGPGGGGGERSFDRDRDRGRDRGRDRDRPVDAAPAVAQDATAPAEVIEVTTAAAAAPIEGRPVREYRDRGDRDRGGSGDRDRGERGGRRERHDTEPNQRIEAAAAAAATPPEVEVDAAEAPKVDDVARAALDRADRTKKPKRGEPTEATREFWETWAETKTTRPDSPADAADGAPADAAPAEERKGRDRGARGGRGRGRGDKRDTTLVTDAPASAPKVSTRAAEAAAAAAEGQARLFVSLGKKHGVSAEDLRALLAGPIGGDTARIGSVSLRDSHAHVRVPEEVAETIIAGVHGTLHNEHNVTVERSRA